MLSGVSKVHPKSSLLKICYELIFLTASAEGGPWASDCVWHKKKNNGGMMDP